MNTTELLDKLPHGSGIDGDWRIEDYDGTIKAYNFYHCMNENGMYDGYADFSITIPVSNPGEFKLHFHGNDAQYLNRKYSLREYLEDIIYYSLTGK